MHEQVFLICIGALISSFAYVFHKLVDRWLDNTIDVTIYRKLVYEKNSDKRPSGIYNMNGEIVMRLPIWIEIQNMKKTPVIIRDFGVVLYKKGRRIKKMKQINYQKDNTKKDSVLVYYGDNGRYSFIIPSESIRAFDLLFVLKKTECPSDFDEINITYYNQKNKFIKVSLKKVEKSWALQQFDVDEDWVEVNKF